MADDPNPLPYIRPAVQNMPPKFDPPTDGLLRHKGLDTAKIRPMGLNECLFPPSPKVIEAIRNNLSMINRYPDAQCPELSDIVAEKYGVSPAHIVWGNGSEEMIKGSIDFAVQRGDGIVLPVPTFWGYLAMVRNAEAELQAIDMRPDGSHDVDDILAGIGNRTRIVFCVTPNNPSGAMLSTEAFTNLAMGVPTNVVLFIDEAYHEFGVHAGGPDVIKVLQARDGPWVVARTFSKAYAMAGMRIGYAVCSDDAVTDALRKTTCVFNVPVLAQAAAAAALADTDHLEHLLARFDEERVRMADGLRALGLAPLETVTNFMSVEVPMNGREALEKMQAKGIQIHAWPHPGYEHFIRITLGDTDDNEACLAALEEVLAEDA